MVLRMPSSLTARCLRRVVFKGSREIYPLRNWEALAPEERWWLYTMTNAATGHAINGRNRGWRKAVRYALTENPVSEGFAIERLELFKVMEEELHKHYASSGD